MTDYLYRRRDTHRPVVDEFVVFWVARQSFHDVTLSVLVGQWDGWDHVGTEVNTEDCNGAEWQRNASCDEDEEWRDLRNVTGQSIRYGLLQVVEYQATFTPHQHTQLVMTRLHHTLSLSDSSAYTHRQTVNHVTADITDQWINPSIINQLIDQG